MRMEKSEPKMVSPKMVGIWWWFIHPMVPFPLRFLKITYKKPTQQIQGIQKQIQGIQGIWRHIFQQRSEK